MDPHPARKILFVITKSNWGGAQSYVYTLARAVKKRGLEPVVVLGGTGIFGSAPGVLAERLAEESIRTIFLEAFTRDVSLAHEYHAFRELLTLIRAERPDVVHVNSSKAGGLGALAARIAHVPRIVFTAHGWPHQEPRAGLVRALIWLASYVTVLLSHIVIVLSQKQYDDAPALFARRKLRVIRNGVGAFPLLSREEARAKLESYDSRIQAFPHLIFSTSELHANKGIDILLRAFANLNIRHPNTALVLAHDGDEREALKELAATLQLTHRVFFLGFVSNVRELLPAADVFVIPSRKEGLPFGLLEAGYAEVPIVASAVGAIPEIINDDVSGLLVPKDDIPALTTALDQILVGRQRARGFAFTLKQRMEREYSEARMVDETLAQYTR